MLVFQNSRRHLLSTLMDRFDTAKDQREKYKMENKAESQNEKQRINNLLKAIEAADCECKKLEYWSDIKNLVEAGKAGTATDPSSGWNKDWQGLDLSGAKHPET